MVDGAEPNVALLRMAANSCCNSCILALSRSDRLSLFVVKAMFDQKPPRTFSIVSSGRPQSVLSVTPLKWFPPTSPPNHDAVVIDSCVAQKPWVRVVCALSWFVNVQVTVCPSASVVDSVRVRAGSTIGPFEHWRSVRRYTTFVSSVTVYVPADRPVKVCDALPLSVAGVRQKFATRPVPVSV